MLLDERTHFLRSATAVADFAPRTELGRVLSGRFANAFEVEGVVRLRVVFVEFIHVVVNDRTIIRNAVAPEVFAVGVETRFVLQDGHTREDEISMRDDERALELACMNIAQDVASTSLSDDERFTIRRNPSEDVFDHANFDDLSIR